jgi:hypothetical protein
MIKAIISLKWDWKADRKEIFNEVDKAIKGEFQYKIEELTREKNKLLRKVEEINKEILGLKKGE